MNHPHYMTFFPANHSINHHLYFISVFIYTCIKVKLTEGEKEMASPKPRQTISADFLFWLQNNPEYQLTNLKDSPLPSHKSQLANPWICLPFCSPNQRNYPRYAVSLRSGGFGAKESDFPHFPSVLRQATKKSVKSAIFDEKTSNFLSSLSFKP